MGDVTDWMSLINTGIQTAGQVAQVALKPPTYSSVTNPYTGASTVTSYGGIPNSSSSLLGGSSFGSLLSDPTVLLLGFGVLAIVLLKR